MPLALIEDRVLPQTADEVVALLDETYPEQCADPSWTDREVWLRAGERRVVRFLIELRRRREEALITEH
jgi:hypothetical protein